MIKKIWPLCIALCFLSACSELELGSHLAKQIPLPSDSSSLENIGYFKVGTPYKIKGRTYYPKEKYQYSETGVASWYGPGFHGKMTANGEIFNQYDLTAAHRTLQMPSMVRVTNLENGKSIIVRVNDRGPFAHNRVIDLSQRAAEVIGMKHKGTARVRVDVLERESRQVAQASRAGMSTRGTELALNRGKTLDDKMPLQVATPVAKPTVPAKTRIASFNNILISQANATQPVRKPVIKSHGKYVVNAGHFSNVDNAMTMKLSLESMGQDVVISPYLNGYRVTVGPFSNPNKANAFARQLQTRGRTVQVVSINH
jgi:rare lipoprotein A